MHDTKDNISVKEVGGELFLFLTYTNNAIDNDYPPDIVSEESQLWFEKQVNDGVFPQPMAFYWHEPGWKFGETVYLFTSKHNDKTFTTAAVRVDPGMESFAKAIAENADSHRVSHMMRVFDRDPNNSIVITRHQTVEVSPLPAGKEANPGTGVVKIVKDNDMTKKNIDAGKRAAAAEALDVDESVLDEVEALNDARADEIEGRLSKELTTKAVEDTVDEAVDGAVAEVPEQADVAEAEEVTFVTAEQMDEIVNVLAENNKALATQISALAKQVETLQKAIDNDTSEEKLAAIKEYIPVAARASWADVLKMNMPTAAANGSLTKEEVDQLAPEAPAEKEGDGPFAVPILNRLAKGKGL